jgi:hypothetical protein
VDNPEHGVFGRRSRTLFEDLDKWLKASSSDSRTRAKVAPGQGIELPDGFADAHSKEECNNDDPEGFHEKEAYIELFDKVRAASLAALDAYAESDLDNPAPEDFRTFCPTTGDMFTLIATHPMMHAGQFVIVRRQLGKPILM